MFIEKSYVQNYTHSLSEGLTFSLTSKLLNDFEQTISDTAVLIRGSGFGIALRHKGEYKILAGTSALISQLDPTQFYTQRTLDDARVTEIMMPFGLMGKHAFPVDVHLDIHYFIGMPIFIATGECVGCIFGFSDKHTSLSEKEKTTLQIISQNLALKLDNEVNRSTDLMRLSTLQFLVNHFEEAIVIKNIRFEIVCANNAFLAFYPEAMRDQVIGFTTLEHYQSDEVAVFLQDDKDAFAQGQKIVTEKIALPSGEIRTFITTKTRFEYAGESFIFGVSKDISTDSERQKALTASARDVHKLSTIVMQEMHKPLDKIQRLSHYVIEDNDGLLDSITLSHLREIQQHCADINNHFKALANYTKVYTDIDESEQT